MLALIRFTRAASSTCGHAKGNFLSVGFCPSWCRERNAGGVLCLCRPGCDDAACGWAARQGAGGYPQSDVRWSGCELKWTRQQTCISEGGYLGYPLGRGGSTRRNGSAASRCKPPIWGRMRFSLPTGVKPLTRTVLPVPALGSVKAPTAAMRSKVTSSALITPSRAACP